MKTILSLTSLFFVRDIFVHMPVKISLWILVLMTVHFIAPLFFLEHTAAQWMAGTFVLGGMILGWMHMKMGITRAMGVAHIVWLAPMVLIYADLFSGAYSGAYFTWLAAAGLIGTICLFIDIKDIIAYVGGDRTQFAPPAP